MNGLEPMDPAKVPENDDDFRSQRKFQLLSSKLETVFIMIGSAYIPFA